MRIVKVLLWFVVTICWSPIEVLHITCFGKISKVASFLEEKINKA